MTPRAIELMNAAVDGEATAGDLRELEALVAQDAALRDEYEQLRAATQLLSSLPALEPPPGLAAAIVANAAPARPQLSAAPGVLGSRPAGERNGLAQRGPISVGRFVDFIWSKKESLMSDVTRGFLSTTRSRVLAGGALAIAALAVVATQVSLPTDGGSTAGTIAPAQRYRSAQQPDASVQVGNGGAAMSTQPVQSAESGAANAANNAAANAANNAAANAAANAANNAAANAANNAAANAANNAAANAAANAANNAAANAAANAANSAAANAANAAAANAANNAAANAAANAANNAAANAANKAAANAANAAAANAANAAANNAAANAANKAAANAANKAAN